MVFFLKLNKLITILTRWTIVSIMSCMIVMAIFQILLRNIFETSIEWGDIFLRHLVLWIGFLGAIVATDENRHISVEVITKYLPDKTKKILSIIISLFATYICYILFIASYEFLLLEKETGGNLLLNIPIWYFIIIIPTGYLVMAFRFLLSLIIKIKEIINKNWSLPVSHQ